MSFFMLNKVISIDPSSLKVTCLVLSTILCSILSEKKTPLGASSDGLAIIAKASKVIAFNLKSLIDNISFDPHDSNIVINGLMGITVL